MAKNRQAQLAAMYRARDKARATDTAAQEEAAESAQQEATEKQGE